MLEDVSRRRYKFSYRQQNEERDITIRSFDFDKDGSLAYDFKMRGVDYMGTFKSEGKLIMTDSGPFFWMAVVYDNVSSAARVAGKKGNKYYESHSVKTKRAAGRWFYEGSKESEEYSGSWVIKDRIS
jgi:hypothetical protein